MLRLSWRIRLLILNAVVLIAAAIVTSPGKAHANAVNLEAPALDEDAGGFHKVFDREDRLPAGIWPAGYAHPERWNDTAWSERHAEPTERGLHLRVSRHRIHGKRHQGAEMHINGTHHYGRYEVVMQPARGDGLISAFFTFTGAAHGTPKDEIDIEFVGNNTRQVQLNYFTGGTSYGGAWIDLPYDAADHPQLYAFEWTPSEIRWFVGDQLVYRADGERLALPTYASTAMLSTWAAHPSLSGWTGPITYEDGARSTVHCVSYAPPGDWGAQCSDTFETDLPSVVVANGSLF
ncbi:MAG: family 16 glycosylhydrolase [Pseudomonadota bacterium]